MAPDSAVAPAPPFTTGDRVRIRFSREPKTWSPCRLHLTSELPLEGAIGVVDRIDRRFAEHNVIVVFRTVVTRPFGEPWVDGFKADELELVEPRYAF